MATTRQVAEIVCRRLGLPAARADWVTRRLRSAELLPATQGVATPISRHQSATILIAALAGNRAADGDGLPGLYADLRVDGWGPTLADTLADGIEGRQHILELRLDLAAPGAVVTMADGHHAIVQRFTDDSARPNYRREAIVAGDVLAQIFTDIRQAPAVRAGRRKRTDTFKV